MKNRIIQSTPSATPVSEEDSERLYIEEIEALASKEMNEAFEAYDKMMSRLDPYWVPRPKL